MTVGIYIHIPFCTSKCPYCDFYSLPAEESLLDGYTAALLRAIRQMPYAPGTVDTIYFGGGTPILMGANRTFAILDALSQTANVAKDAEITLEANPESTRPHVLEELRATGVNRLSFGFQSALPQELALLGRRHTAEEAIAAVRVAKAAGFGNISVDMMIGLPGQTLPGLSETVDIFTSLEPQHISSYLLKIEEGTPFAARYGELEQDEDLQSDLYLHLVDQLAQKGYPQYEISNFARPGFESRHNLKYWNSDPWLGLGPSAHSFWAGRRLSFDRDLPAFLAAPNPWQLLRDDGPGGDFEEYAMLRLRLREGLVFAEVQRRYPDANLVEIHRRATELKGKGLLHLTDTALSLTSEGMLLENQLISFLLL